LAVSSKFSHLPILLLSFLRGWFLYLWTPKTEATNNMPSVANAVVMLFIKNEMISVKAVLTYIDTQPSCGIVKIALPVIWRWFTGLSGALLASPWVMNHKEPPVSYLSITRWIVGASAVRYWIMSPIFIVAGGAFMIRAMSPGFRVGCMLPLAIMVGVKPSKPVLLQTAIKPIRAIAVQ